MKQNYLKSLFLMLMMCVGMSAWAEDFSTTYSYGLSGWELTNYTDQSSYYQVPSGNDPSVATISGIFSGKTITSDVVVTINCGTYGSGTNPSASTFSLYMETACTNAITATQGGTLPTDKNYKDVTYTISKANAASLNEDLAIKITKPGKTIRLNSIKVEFSYTTGPAKTLTSITVSGSPKKTSYFDGDVLDPAGLVVTGTYDSGDPEVITEGIEWTFDPETLSAGNTTCDVMASVGSVLSDIYPVTGLTVTAVPTYTAHFSVNGVDDHSADFVGREGAAITFPADPSATSGKVFTGWVTTPIAGTINDAPSFINKTNQVLGTADVTYYAVFATAEAGEDTWNQVTTLANITEGQYVIKNGAFVLSNALASSSAPAALDAPAVTTGVITGTVEDNMIFNLTSTGTANQFYVKNPDGKYLYATNNNNGLRVNTTQDKWTFAVNTTDYFSMKDANNSRYCGKYTDGSDWRSYTSATAANYVNSGKLELYKLTSNTTYSDYCTSFANVTLIGIEITGTPAEFWKGDAFNHNGITVTATWSDETETNVTAQSEFSTPDMATAGEKTVTVTYQGETATYNISVQTIANTLANAYTTAQAMALIDAGKDLGTEVFVEGVVSKVDSYNETYKSITYWLDDNAFEIYGGLAADGKEFSSVDDIEVGAMVVVFGKIKDYKGTYEMDKDNHLVIYEAPSMPTYAGSIEIKAGGYDEVTEAYWGTYYTDKAYTMPEGLTGYYVTVKNGKILLDQVYNGGDAVDKNTGLLIRANQAKTYNYVGATTGYDGEEFYEYDMNHLKGSVTSETFSESGYKYYKFSNGSNGLGFYYAVNGGTSINNGANKAFLKVAEKQANDVKAFSLSDIEDAIHALESKSVDTVIYDMQGRKVSKTQKGLYIVNGKKYMVK